jgi:GntR family transcriptional regulator
MILPGFRKEGDILDERQVGVLSFQLDLSQPIYEQILQQMCGAIARGEIALGDKIPSVRDMAQGLKVTPNTVMHAYQEIERYGLTETRRGQGTYITTSQEKVNHFRQELARKIMDEFFEKMRNLGYSHEDIEHYLRKKQGGKATS